MNDTKEKHATHTPGPWVVKHDKEGFPFIGVASDPWTYPGTVATVEQEKDARLIAAAPEMYEMCKLFEYAFTLISEVAKKGGPDSKGAIGLFEDLGFGEKKMNKLREVLAKVDGGEG